MKLVYYHDELERVWVWAVVGVESKVVVGFVGYQYKMTWYCWKKSNGSEEDVRNYRIQNFVERIEDNVIVQKWYNCVNAKRSCREKNQFWKCLSGSEAKGRTNWTSYVWPRFPIQKCLSTVRLRPHKNLYNFFPLIRCTGCVNFKGERKTFFQLFIFPQC